jgi:hypothetical protein
VRSQERDERGARIERIGDRRGVSQGDGSAELTADLGHEQRAWGRGSGTVQGGQALQCVIVVSVRRTDRDLGVERVHGHASLRFWRHDRK